MSHIYAAKGKKIVHVDLTKGKPNAKILTSLLLGPSGYLRAPVWRKGKVFLVGYHEETYRDLLL